MAMAEHNPSAVSSKNKGVLGMSHQQLHDFASGSMKGKPVHVAKANGAHPHKNLGHFLHPKKAK
jgi:hypothetical protein